MKAKKNRSATSIFLFVLLFWMKQSNAQPFFDVANIYWQQSPNKSLYHSNENSLKTNLISASLQAAFKVKKDYVIINPFADYYELRFWENPKQKLYGIGMSLTYLKQWKNEKWSTAFVAIPRLNTEMKNVSGNDYQMGGAVLATYKKNEKLSYKFGVYYNSEHFGALVVPLIGVEWKVSEKLGIFGVFPNQLNLEYKFNKTFYAGFEANFIINSYRFADDSFLRMDDNHVKIYLDTYLTKNIVLNLQAGQSVLRKYRTGVRENGTTHYNELDVNDGVLFKAGIVYRIRMDEKKEAGN